jgi:STE24 endopeptidase
MNPYPWLLFILILANAGLDVLLDALSLRRLRGAGAKLPSEFEGVFDKQKYEKALAYQAANHRFDMNSQLVDTPLLLAFLFFGGFNAVDLWARAHAQNRYWTGLLFIAGLAALKLISQIPWSIYRTFVIEERFGFNKTTPKIFVLDLIKGVLIGCAIGAPVFAGIVYFFEKAGALAWFYSWLAFTAVQLVLTYAAPAVLMPLFNKFKELPDGELKSAVEQYNARNHFKISGIFTMDSSRRSTKGNAFFTGFGRFRRLVLFDTLIAAQTTDELVAIFAHEVGHFKLGHIIKSVAISIALSALMFFVFSLFIGNADLFSAFKMRNISVYASLVFIGFLYSPIARIQSLFIHALSRKAEFEADRYSADTFGKPETLISALKKLSADNLSNLDPHPLRVFFDYTHPPIMKRIEHLRRLQPAR